MTEVAAFKPLGRRRWFLLWRGWVMCDGCRKMRPHWWARRRWEVLGGQAGYYDFCSRLCELAHIKRPHGGRAEGSRRGER